MLWRACLCERQAHPSPSPGKPLPPLPLRPSLLTPTARSPDPPASPQVLLIPEMSPEGGQQMAADVEYLCNVVSALHSAPPASLLTVQLFSGMPADAFAEAAQQAAQDGGADMPTLRALAAMRKIAI
jgi:hypothetical protein